MDKELADAQLMWTTQMLRKYSNAQQKCFDTHLSSHNYQTNITHLEDDLIRLDEEYAQKIRNIYS